MRNFTAAAIAAAWIAAVTGSLIAAHEPHLSAALSARLRSSDADFLALFLGGMRRMALPFAVFTALSSAGALCVFAGLMGRRPLWSGSGLAAIAIAGSTLFAGTLKPASARMRSMKTFAAQIQRQIAGAPLYVAHGHDYELSYYCGRGIWGLDLADPAVLRADLAADRPVYVVARPRELAQVSPALRDRMKVVMQSGLAGGDGAPALYQLAPGVLN